MRNSQGHYLQDIDGLPYKLKGEFDFRFIGKYGRVFKIFDDQDSGNICFGTEKDGARFFIKFAGAPTERYDGTAENAIARLRSTVPIYCELRHPSLIELIDAEDIGNGFALRFKWADGVCMGRMYPASHQKFMQSDTETRLAVFQDILSFFEYVISKGYVAVDFYDGSIMHDFETHRTTICDIDFFAKMPYINQVGRMWGSSRFMSPEEYQLGADIDEVTNVYTLGATAFALFAAYHRTRESWTLNPATYEVACKATDDARSVRQPSIQELRREWEMALCR